MMKINISNLFKHFLLGVICLFLLMPAFQKHFEFFKFKPLKGYAKEKKDPTFSFQTWFDGSYQIKKDQYLNTHIGARPFFVRAFNQIHFSLFKQTHAKGIIFGKDDYLFEEAYIHAYLGRDSIGAKKIEEQVFKMQKIHDTLRSMNIDLVVILAAGKASYHSEKIPDSYNPTDKWISNYDRYQKAFSEGDLNFIDFNKWFLEMKEATPHPLFPKGGIHWSKYGEILVSDSLVKYVSNLRSIPMAKLIIDSVRVSDQMKGTDEDIEGLLNLPYNLEDLEMGYPVIHFEKDSSIIKPRLIGIGDSYYWGITYSGITKKAFSDSQFWYYNSTIYPTQKNGINKVSQVNLQEQIERQDVIFLMASETNLVKFPYKFVDKAYEVYFRK